MRLIYKFESFVNSERCKTIPRNIFNHVGLRALLIQKDVKHTIESILFISGLRALLIQKDVKQILTTSLSSGGLRALLIQKDVKLRLILRWMV